MKNPFAALSDMKLKHEAGRLESVQAEIARRAEVAAGAKEKAEAEATAKRNAVKVAEFQKLVETVYPQAVAEQKALDAAICGLQAYVRRDIALTKLRELENELGLLGSPQPTPLLPVLSREAIDVAERLWTPLGCEMGVAVVARPLLVYR